MKPSTSKSSNNTSHYSSFAKKYTGVQQRAHGQWGSYIGCDKRWISLGSYPSPEDAARAHDAAFVFLHGSQPEVLWKLNFPNSPPDIPSSIGQPYTQKQLKEIAREYVNRVRTEPVIQPALGTADKSNKPEVEEENENDDPIDWWWFMDENRDDSYVDCSLVDACSSLVSPRQAGLDFSGYNSLPLSEPVPEHQVLDNVKEEEVHQIQRVKPSTSRSSNNNSHNSTSVKKYTGVRQKRYGRWESYIRSHGRQIGLGSYATPEEAAQVRDAAFAFLHGSQPEVICQLNFPNSPPDVPSSVGQPFTKEQVKEIAKEYVNRVRTKPVQPAFGTGERSNETEVEEYNENNDPIDWSFMDENRNDSYVDWSLVDACASPVLPRQAGLDFSGYDFLPLSESVPEHLVPNNAEEEEVRLWNFSD